VGSANYEHTSILVVEAWALRDRVHLAVQEGYRQISIEGDHWIDNYNLSNLLNVRAKSIYESEVTISEFINGNQTYDVAKLNQTLHNHSMIQKIKGITIPLNNVDDTF